MFVSRCLKVFYQGNRVCNKWRAEWSPVAYEVRKAFPMAA